MTSQNEEDESFLEKCPECGNLSVISDLSRGEIICNNCGLVLMFDRELTTIEKCNICQHETCTNKKP